MCEPWNCGFPDDVHSFRGIPCQRRFPTRHPRCVHSPERRPILCVDQRSGAQQQVEEFHFPPGFWKIIGFPSPCRTVTDTTLPFSTLKDIFKLENSECWKVV